MTRSLPIIPFASQDQHTQVSDLAMSITIWYPQQIASARLRLPQKPPRP